MSATGERPDGGFTLLEMLVTLAILALIGGLVFPDLRRGVAAYRLRGAAIDAVTVLRAARARAVAVQGRVRVGVGAGGQALLVSGFAPERLANPLRARIAPEDGITFFGDGSSNGGALSILAGERELRFTVSPTTGLARRAG